MVWSATHTPAGSTTAVTETEEEEMAHIDEKNFPAFKKAYQQAARDQLITFNFEGAEVLTKYAQYVVEAFNRNARRK